MSVNLVRPGITTEMDGKLVSFASSGLFQTKKSPPKRREKRARAAGFLPTHYPQ
jgi:hypothetical protein